MSWLIPLVSVAVLGSPPDRRTPSFRVEVDPSPPHCVRLYGLSRASLAAVRQQAWGTEKWQAVFRVEIAVDGLADQKLPPVAGRYVVDTYYVRFEPRFALQSGQKYRVRVWPHEFPAAEPNAPNAWEQLFLVPQSASDTPAARVVAIYPTSDTLPENQLKFYIYFSQPMRRGEAYRHIQLIDDHGEVVPYPFLELPEELWDPSQQRFTLLLDPGRIKRGLKPREQFGPVLEAGRRYRLVIDAGWSDALGRPLAETASKSFRVTQPDDQQPQWETWKLQLPRAGSREPLVVQFDEMLDHGLLQRMIWVVDAQGNPLAGSGEAIQKETAWRFVPEAPWQPGEYRLCVDTRLEDLAGNNLVRPFEVDLFEQVEARAGADVRVRPFHVAP